MTKIETEFEFFRATKLINIGLFGKDYGLNDFKLEGYHRCNEEICLPQGYSSKT